MQSKHIQHNTTTPGLINATLSRKIATQTYERFCGEMQPGSGFIFPTKPVSGVVYTGSASEGEGECVTRRADTILQG